MTRIVVDEALRTRFHNFAEPFELCDESGRVLARVIPQFGTPWLEGAGMFSEETLFEDWQRAIRDYRNEMNQLHDAP